MAQGVGQKAARPHLAEAAIEEVASLGLVAVVRCGDVAVAEMDARLVEAQGGDHAVAVEPVGEPLPGQLVATRTVAIERAAQAARHLALYLGNAVAVLLLERAKAAAPGKRHVRDS